MLELNQLLTYLIILSILICWVSICIYENNSNIKQLRKQLQELEVRHELLFAFVKNTAITNPPKLDKSPRHEDNGTP